MLRQNRENVRVLEFNIFSLPPFPVVASKPTVFPRLGNNLLWFLEDARESCTDLILIPSNKFS